MAESGGVRGEVVEWSIDDDDAGPEVRSITAHECAALFGLERNSSTAVVGIGGGIGMLVCFERLRGGIGGTGGSRQGGVTRIGDGAGGTSIHCGGSRTGFGGRGLLAMPAGIHLYCGWGVHAAAVFAVTLDPIAAEHIVRNDKITL